MHANLMGYEMKITYLSTTAGGFNTHSPRSGSARDDDNLALEAEELLERIWLWDWDHDCGIEVSIFCVGEVFLWCCVEG